MEAFETLVKKSYNFNQDIFDNDVRWKLLQHLYDKNYINANREGSKIPKKIHQVWLGGNMPDKFKEYGDTWKAMNPDWEYRMWTEKDLNDVHIPSRQVFDSLTNVAQKSDYLRYHILYQFGGLYVDTDFECLKPFDSLSYLDFYVGVGYPAKAELYIGLIASVPQYRILAKVINNLHIEPGSGWRTVFNTTGTYYFTNIFFKSVSENTTGVVAFPNDYFYPFPNESNHEELNGKDYVQECSYALHHWAVSWSKKKKKK